MIALGIDSGTQSTKTIALDIATGELLASAAHGYGLIEGLPPGHLEQDPKEWIDAVNQTVAAVIVALGKRKVGEGDRCQRAAARLCAAR